VDIDAELDRKFEVDLARGRLLPRWSILMSAGHGFELPLDVTPEDFPSGVSVSVRRSIEHASTSHTGLLSSTSFKFPHSLHND